jgi:hypothetical protein
MLKQSLILRQRVVGPWQANTYALVCPSSLESALIDPGAESDQLKLELTRHPFKITSSRLLM